jgi:hypothetical protein
VEGDAAVDRRGLDLTVLQPVEQLTDRVVLLGDEPSSDIDAEAMT